LKFERKSVYLCPKCKAAYLYNKYKSQRVCVSHDSVKIVKSYCKECGYSEKASKK
jgi:primosomal protein N'